jgi:hypothetical protein
MASEEQNIKAAYSYQRAVEQINGREGETAALFGASSVSFNIACGWFRLAYDNPSFTDDGHPEKNKKGFFC